MGAAVPGVFGVAAGFVDDVDPFVIAGFCVIAGAADAVVTGSGVCVFLFAAIFTVTLHFSFFFPALAVITAVPFFLAVTTPFLLTAATFFLLEDHFTVPL